MYPLLRWFLFKLDPEVSHQFTLRLLSRLGRRKQSPVHHPITLWGLQFPNRVGMAAGWDKNGDCIDALFGLGFGFVEVGTVTPRPQAGNPKPRLFRLQSDSAIINRMGFNNKGVDYLVSRLQSRTVPGIVGVNIGKNKDTPNERAYEDYLFCLERVYDYADYITINISSPNTPGLRELQSEEALTTLLSKINDRRRALEALHGRRVPLLVKISPDYPHDQLESFVNTLLNQSIDGIIATNTSVDRSLVDQVQHRNEQGGLSGRPIATRSNHMIAALQALAGDRLPIIGVGGIDSEAAAKEKFRAGAALIQLYSGLVYEGPGLIASCQQAATYSD